MGNSIANVTGRARTILRPRFQKAKPGAPTEEATELDLGLDFALIGHQESWRAAADVLAVLRGPEHTPLPDDEIKDILPWIPPRAVCHVEVGSVVTSRIGGA